MCSSYCSLSCPNASFHNVFLQAIVSLSVAGLVYRYNQYNYIWSNTNLYNQFYIHSALLELMYCYKGLYSIAKYSPKWLNASNYVSPEEESQFLVMELESQGR